VKSWIRIQIRIKVRIEPWRAVDAHNGGLEAQNKAMGSQIPFTLKGSWIRIRIKVKSWIRIHIEVTRIRNPERHTGIIEVLK
jgi:hypothetical protein